MMRGEDEGVGGVQDRNIQGRDEDEDEDRSTEKARDRRACKR